jgi:hypothetical protein
MPSLGGDVVKKIGFVPGVVNSIKSSVGVGLFSIPYMMICAGPAYGVALLTGIVMTSCFCVEQLLACRHALQAAASAAIAEVPSAVEPAAVALLEAVLANDQDDSSDESAAVMGGGGGGGVDFRAGVAGAGASSNTVVVKRHTYPNIALRTLGPAGRWATIATLWLAMYGSNISYLIFMKQNLPALVPAMEPVVRASVACTRCLRFRQQRRRR